MLKHFFLSPLSEQKRNFNIIKKNKQTAPLVGAFHDFNLRCVYFNLKSHLQAVKRIPSIRENSKFSKYFGICWNDR